MPLQIIPSQTIVTVIPDPNNVVRESQIVITLASAIAGVPTAQTLVYGYLGGWL